MAEYFTNQEINTLASIEGKILKKVICYFWINKLNPNESIELIDNIECVFHDETSIVITCNENSTGISILNDFNIEDEKKALSSNHGDKIKIIPIDASKTKMWESVINEALESIDVTKEGGSYLNDALILNFGSEKRTIGISPLDGLIIDYWED